MTQMMLRWQEVKAKHPDCIVFFRLGDFYEMFFDDAKTASAILGITLTGRECGEAKRAPMCGVPYHSANTYIKKLIDNNQKVAICEQLTAPKKGVAMIERDVIKIITAGTYDDENFLDSKQNNFVASVYTSGDAASISWCDITTGEFFAMNLKTANLKDILAMICAKEIIESNGHYGYAFNAATAYANILRYFNITSTKIFDLEKDDRIINSAGALLHYLQITQKQTSQNITKIKVIQNNEFMLLDSTARENLELVHAYHMPSQKKGSLLWVLDETQCAMGARELVNWISRPLQKIEDIKFRQDQIETLANDPIKLKNIRNILCGIADISRLCGKAASGSILPRDMLALCSAIERSCVLEGVVPLKNLTDAITSAIREDAPAKTDDGGYIKSGYNAQLDEYKKAEASSHDWLSRLEAAEREATKIKELKVLYNRIIGYYFEVPTRLAKDMPYRFTRKGSTLNAERYTNDELKDIESKILNAHENAVVLEAKLFAGIRDLVVENLDTLVKNSKTIANIDCIQSLATVAVNNNFARPNLNKDCKITLKNARHPVVEKLIGRANFIANDCDICNNTMLITGPNMAGKSTYMRMVAVNTLMAHIGSFVPCDFADISLTDRIFTRIGASDSLLTGESTFMLEMNETSNIVNNATKNSLILIDEIGRGTGTSDGLALASAILTYISQKIGSNTLFATHFHELTNLAGTDKNIKNFKVLTEQVGGEIVFLHKLEQGIEPHSFGIDVAKLAGLPKEIIDNARRILK
jgi:DNA mismatch repair protein MutS